MWDWSDLPPEIIHVISLRIDNPFDLIHFRSICSPWRSSSLSTFRRIPSLKCPRPLDVEGYKSDCHVLRSRVYLITKSLPCAPPKFWLFKLREDEKGSISLQCLLPERTSIDWGSRYPSLSLDLLNSQVIELAEEHVACYSFWCHQFDAKNKTRYPRDHRDRITFFNGKIYAIHRDGVTRSIKPTLELSSFRRSRPCFMTMMRWLVKSGDKLLLVEMCTRRMIEYYNAELLAEKGWFEISELNKEENDWIQMEDLGGRILFLDENCSFSCLPSQIPGFKPNSIIFEHSEYQVFEFGKQGFRALKDIPEYIQLIQSFPWIISNE